MREVGGAGLGALLFSASGVETVGYVGHLGPYSEDNCLSRRAKATPLCPCLLKLEDNLQGEQTLEVFCISGKKASLQKHRNEF